MAERDYRKSLFLSVLLHAAFLFCFAWMLHRQAQMRPHAPTWVELMPVPEPAPRIASKNDGPTRKQIVQTERGKIVQTAPKDAFLGEKNQEVDRETVSVRKMTTMGSQPGSPSQAKAASQASPKAASAPQVAALGLPIMKRLQELSRETEQEAQRPDWATPGVRPEDYAKGIAESERTALNTREYLYYGYYQRIRERLDRAWLPILKTSLVKFYRGGRHLASDMDHTTRVVVVLNSLGEIVRVQMVGESGTRDLDEAAVKAFNQAGPFPNPPRGMIGPTGEIQVPWEFILRT